jgi:hypothetical protein
VQVISGGGGERVGGREVVPPANESGGAEQLSVKVVSRGSEWRCEVCMVMNKGESGKCVCCEATRPTQGEHAPTAAAAAGAAAAAAAITAGVAASGPVLASSKGGSGFQFPISTSRGSGFQFPVSGNSEPTGREGGREGGREVGCGGVVTHAATASGKRRERDEEDDVTDEDDRGDTPVVKRGRGAGVVGRMAHGQKEREDAEKEREDALVKRGRDGRVADEEREREDVTVPRVIGSPRLLSYSFLATDLEAATSFLQEVAGMEVRGHEDHYQTLTGGLSNAFNGSNEARYHQTIMHTRIWLACACIAAVRTAYKC